MPMRVAFLGPEGTYGERAARSLMKLEDIENPVLVACSGLRSVVEHVADGRCESAVVPVENSVEGGVTAILDALWSYSNLRIRRAVVLPIRHALLSSGSLDGISEVLSHPQALAQCSIRSMRSCQPSSASRGGARTARSTRTTQPTRQSWRCPQHLRRDGAAAFSRCPHHPRRWRTIAATGLFCLDAMDRPSVAGRRSQR